MDCGCKSVLHWQRPPLRASGPRISCRFPVGWLQGKLGAGRKRRCAAQEWGRGRPLALDAPIPTPRPLRARLGAWSGQPRRVPELWIRACSCGTGDARPVTLWSLRLSSHFRRASQIRPEVLLEKKNNPQFWREKGHEETTGLGSSRSE